MGITRAIEIEVSIRIIDGMFFCFFFMVFKTPIKKQKNNITNCFSNQSKLFFFFCTKMQESCERVIIDTDPGIDDCMALFLAFSRPDRVKVVKKKNFI